MSVSKIVAAAASGVGGAGLDVDEVFSTFLYEATGDTSYNAGNGSDNAINNDIDLSGEGGLVWIKSREHSSSPGLYETGHFLYDTVRGAGKYIRTNKTNAQVTANDSLKSFNSNGFTLGKDSDSQGVNYQNRISGEDHVSWTFRKAPKFFDVVTYTGNSTAGRTVSHNLGSVPGMILVKCTSNSGDWVVYHRGLSNPTGNMLQLNSNTSEIQGRWNNTAPTSTEFTLNDSLGVNGTGRTFVAYLFAHNNNDGEFGPDGDADIIKCGVYAASSQPNFINVGFEPQWLLIKNITTSVGDWYIYDSMRGVPTGSGDKEIEVNDNAAEATSSGGGQDWVDFNATGFTLKDNYEGVNQSGKNYIYVAIRRGPLAVPEDATKVFAINNPQSQQIDPGLISGFPVDFALGKIKNSSTNWYAASRLTGTGYLETNNTTAEQTTSSITFDYNNGWWDNVNNTGFVGWMWKRAPSYFDVVAWTGNDTAGRTVAHNLGVVPEMIWVKNRSATVEWVVYHKDVSNGFLKLNTNDEKIGAYVFGAASGNDAQSATNIILSSGNGVNELNKNYIGYLFATVAGVSKVGSYTGTGNNIDINCGFSSGARFVLIKRTDASVGGSWWVVDTVRGLTSGNDPIIRLDETDAEYTSFNPLTPLSSGFTVASTATADFNASGGSYIFYAIA